MISRKWQNLCLVLILALAQIKAAPATPAEKTPLFEHDVRLSESASNSANEGWNPYFGSSGIVFVSDQTVAEYVLRLQEGSLLQRHAPQASDGYTLTITLFDLEQKKAVAKNDIPVPGKSIRLFRSKDGNLILCTQSWIALLSPGLQVLNQVRLSERFGDADVLSAVDITGEHLYLAGESTEQCPELVQVLDAELLVTQKWWCLNEKTPSAFYGAQSAFYGDAAIQYHKGGSGGISTLQIYRNGGRGGTIHPPGLGYAEQAIFLSQNVLLLNGASLLRYDLRKGVEFSTAVAKNWNIVSPINCDAAGRACAMAIAISKSDFFDVARETILKDVAIAVVNAKDGGVLFRQSIKNLFSDSSHIKFSDVSDIRLVVAPDGKCVGVWHGSAWQAYAVQ